MRVISGKCRGTNLVAPEGLKTRPTTDRIKETLFNMINFDLLDCDFLDLFSGSGAIGIESLSRGANSSTFVDMDKDAFRCITQNLEKTRLKDKATVINTDIFMALNKLKGKKYDIIFMDPPYALAEIEKTLQTVADYGLLKEDGYIILERSTDKTINLPQNLVLWKEKVYKTTTLTFIRYGE